MLLLLAPAAHGAPVPRRIVSLNPCLDAILLDVADPAQITALSRYSVHASEFAMAEEARSHRHISGSAEEVALLRPDLVLVSGMGAAPLMTVLPRLHIAYATFAVPSSVDESLAQVRRVAALAGHPGRGEALVARIRAAIRTGGASPRRAAPVGSGVRKSGPGGGPGHPDGRADASRGVSQCRTRLWLQALRRHPAGAAPGPSAPGPALRASRAGRAELGGTACSPTPPWRPCPSACARRAFPRVTSSAPVRC